MAKINKKTANPAANSFPQAFLGLDVVESTAKKPMKNRIKKAWIDLQDRVLKDEPFFEAESKVSFSHFLRWEGGDCWQEGIVF